jgi:hypothetical protein
VFGTSESTFGGLQVVDHERGNGGHEGSRPTMNITTKGSLTAGGVPLRPKGAKPLPSSD